LRSDAADSASGALTFSGVTTFNNTVNINPNGYQMTINSDGSRRLIDFQRNGSLRMSLDHQTGQDDFNFAFTSGSNLKINGNRILTTADEGSGNGLDADTLDGQQGSYYASASSLSNYLPLSGGNLTGPLQITGNASYVGNYGYSTLVLQDSGGYAGIDFRNGTKDWLFRNDGGNDSLQWVWRNNGNHTERMELTSGGVLTVNGNTVWHAGNDGSNSGLDADTVDGLHASAFLTSIPDNYVLNTGDTITGTLSYSTGYNVPMWRHGTSGPYVRSDGTYLVMDRGSGGGGDQTFYINNFSQIYTSVPLRLNNDTTDVLNFTANSTNTSRGISFNNRTALSASTDGWLRLNNASEFSNGTYSPKKIASAEQLVGGNSSVTSGGTLAVANTTNPYLSFHEGATRRAYIQYLTTDHDFLLKNEEGNEFRFDNNATSNHLRMHTSSTYRGSVYANNSNQIGFLDSGGAWAIKHSNDNGTYFYTDGETEEFKVGRDTVTGNYGTVQVSSNKGGWGGYSIYGNWVLMSNGSPTCGIYNDTDNEWSVYCTRNAETRLYYNGVETIRTVSGGIDVSGDIYVDDQIIHNGDTNTYMQFHAADQWRVVTGGTERLEVNNSAITSAEPIYAPSFHGDGSNLTNLPGGGPVLLAMMQSAKRPGGSTTVVVPSSAVGYSTLMLKFRSWGQSFGPVLSLWGFNDARGTITYSNLKYNNTSLNGGGFDDSTYTCHDLGTTTSTIGTAQDGISSFISSTDGIHLGGSPYESIIYLTETITSTSSFCIQNYSTGSSNQTSYIVLEIWGLS